MTGRVPGLPCAWCSGPTHLTRAEVWACERCDHTEERPVAALTANPMHCAECNP